MFERRRDHILGRANWLEFPAQVRSQRLHRGVQTSSLYANVMKAIRKPLGLPSPIYKTARSGRERSLGALE